MAKFSLFGDEDENDKEFCIRSPKRRRLNIPQASSSYSHPPHQQYDQQKQHSKDEDEDGDETNSVGNWGPNKADGSISVTLSDPDVLDCPICFNPLIIPVFQCHNGHITCSSCCINLGNKCPSCCGNFSQNRCRAIEKVIESVQVSCCYFKYGCKESISFCRKHEHEEKCIFAPCSCPFPDCLFRGSPRKLSSHLCKEHEDLVTRFCHNSVFSVSLGIDKRILVLQEEKDGILFVLTQGNSIAVRCVDPSFYNGRFAYDLVLRAGSTSLKFQSFTHCTTGQFNNHPSADYFLIPDYFYNSDDLLKLKICIWSKDACLADRT